MEKVRPQRGQPSDRGRLKNRTEHYYIKSQSQNFAPPEKKFPAVPLVSNLCSPCRVTEHTPFGGRLSLAIMCKHMASSVKTGSTLSQCRQTRTDPRTWTGTSAGFWLGGECPPCHLRRRKFWKFDYELVHSEVYLNKYVVSIAPFSTPACPDCSQNIT